MLPWRDVLGWAEWGPWVRCLAAAPGEGWGQGKLKKEAVQAAANKQSKDGWATAKGKGRGGLKGRKGLEWASCQEDVHLSLSQNLKAGTRS